MNLRDTKEEGINMDVWLFLAIIGLIGAAFALYLLRGLPPKHRH